MAEVLRLEQLVSKLRARAAKAARESNICCVVGFTAGYSIFVHENLEAHHPVGQAKFLEEPARTLAGELGHMIGAGMRAGLTIGQSLLRAGLRLQRASQQKCPIDTGALRASAFTRLEPWRR